jgi:hypothetical protein
MLVIQSSVMMRAILSQVKGSISHINGPAQQAEGLQVEHRVGQQISTDKVRRIRYLCTHEMVF